MKQPILQSISEVKYKFKRLTPLGVSAKDSCSFTYEGENYMMCSYLNLGGIIVFKETNGDWLFFHAIYDGWTMLWAPCAVKEENGKLIVFCNDTGGDKPWWQTQRIKYFEYVPGVHPAGPTEVQFNVGPKGRIDPEVVRVGNTFIMFYVIMDWNETTDYDEHLDEYVTTGDWEWWDIYYSISDKLTGPYNGEWNLSAMTEYGIEEAPHVIGNQLYWSVKDSSVDSFTRRGSMYSDGKVLIIKEEPDFKLACVDSPICTHPDSFNGKIRATLKDKYGEYYIGELL